MVNRGDGGSRRPAPPARPAPRPPARPGVADDGEEKTSAINLADVNLDEIDEEPVRPSPPPRKVASRDFGDDDNEATNAINLASMGLDEIDEEPVRPQPAARPQPGPQPGARPAQAARPAPSAPKPPARPAPAPSHDDDGEEKTSAINLGELNQADVVAQARAKLAAARGAPAPTPTPAKAAAPAPRAPEARPAPRPEPKPEPKPEPRPEIRRPPPKVEEPVFEKTMAVSLDDVDVEATKAKALAKLKAAKGPGKSEPAAADKTFLVDDEDVPVVKAPEPKRLPAALQAKAEEAPARGGSGVVEPEAKLAIVAGPDKGKVYTLTRDLTLVGRGVDADCVINDASASRKHFNIVRTLNGYKLVDLGSGNGTRVDGERVSELALKPGMKIEAGGTTLEWRMETPAGAKAAASGPPAPRSPTLAPAEAEPPSRRAAAEAQKAAAAPERKRDAGRLDKLANLDDEPRPSDKGKGLGQKSAADDVEEKTSFGDIAALEIDPEWEARRQKQRKDGVAGQADAIVAKASAVLEEDEAEPPKKSGAGKKIAIAAVVVGVLGGGFVAADKFAGLGIIFPKTATVDKPKDDAPKEADKAPDKEPAKDPDKTADKEPAKDPDKEPAKANAGVDKALEEAKALVKEGDEHAEAKRFIAANRAYAKAVAIDEAIEGGPEGQANVEKQIKSLTPVVEALALIDTRAFADLHTKLDSVPEFSVYKQLTGEIIETAKEDILVELLAKASELILKNDYKAAKDLVEDALAFAGPDFSQGAALKDALERGLAADGGKRDADPTQDGTATDFTAGFEAYKKGEYGAAADKFASAEFESAVTKADVGKSRLFSSAVIITEEQLKFASTLLNKPEEAAPAVRSVRRADALMGFGQRAAVEKIYANVAGFHAKTAAEAGDLPLASLKARVALALDPAQADAKAALAKAVEAGKAALTEAQAAIEAEPDKAAQLLVKALRLLPASEADHAEAVKLATQLATP